MCVMDAGMQSQGLTTSQLPCWHLSPVMLRMKLLTAGMRVAPPTSSVLVSGVRALGRIWTCGVGVRGEGGREQQLSGALSSCLLL